MNGDRIQGWQTWRRAAGIRESTITVQTSILRRFADTCDLDTTTPDQVAAWLAGHQWSPTARKTAISALRTYFRWAQLHHHRGDDPTASFPAVKQPPAAPRPVPEDMLATALGTADDEIQLMILLAAYAGLRRAEIAGLHRDMLQGDLLHVTGKGGRSRSIPIAGELLTRLTDAPDGWLFPGRFGGPVTPDYVGRRLSAVLGRGWTGHKLRHRYASRIYARTNNLFVLQELLGHSSADTTLRYVALDPDDLRKVAAAAQ